jgi:5-methylcytosine-specific restriction endonuclease McrA
MRHLAVKKLEKDKNDLSISKSRRARAKKIIAILRRDKYKCKVCKTTSFLTIDHTYLPDRYKGGKRTHVIYKLHWCRTLCLDCHKKKNERETKKRKNDVYKQ